MAIFTSSINAELKGRTLKKGAYYALIGGSLFLIAAFMPLSILSTYGLPLFITSCLLIGKGLVPYRNLLLEEMRPNEIHIHNADFFFLYRKKPLFKIKIKDIEQMHFVDNKEGYGISLTVKRPFKKQIVVLTSKMRFASYLAKQKRISHQGDLYLPHFTKHAYDKISVFL